MCEVPEWVDFLLRAGRQAPSADNSQPWRFVWDGRVLSLHMEEEQGKTGLGREHPATLMAMGAVIENLSQAAAALGMPGDALQVHAGNAEGSMATIAWDGALRVPEGASPPLALFRRHTNRGAFSTAPLTHELVARLSSLSEGSLRTLVVNQREMMPRWGTLVREASEVRFQTEEIHRWLAGSLRFTPAEVERGEGMDVASLLLPPGGSSLLKLSLDWRRMRMLNTLGAFKLFAMLEAAMLKKCAALIAVAGPASEVGVEVGAGRLLERLWIALNEEGIAVHPYYVLPDQLYRLRAGRVAPQFQVPVGGIRERVAELLGSREDTVFMLLRVGLPEIADPIRSRRLPLEAKFALLDRQE